VSKSSRKQLISLQGPNDKDTKKKIKQKVNNDEEYELSRFKPSIRAIIEVIIATHDPITFAHGESGPSCGQARDVIVPLCERRPLSDSLASE
jgi:hypothetical protein